MRVAARMQAIIINKNKKLANASFLLFFIAQARAIACEGVEFIAILTFGTNGRMYALGVYPHKKVIFQIIYGFKATNAYLYVIVTAKAPCGGEVRIDVDYRGADRRFAEQKRLFSWRNAGECIDKCLFLFGIEALRNDVTIGTGRYSLFL